MKEEKNYRIRTDRDGRKVAVVNVGKGKQAVLNADDFWMLIELGVPQKWYLIPGDYVVASDWAHNRRPKVAHLNIGRVLLDANRGETVQYKDGNPLNLRRENLGIRQSGWGKMRARDQIVPRCTRCKQKVRG